MTAIVYLNGQYLPRDQAKVDIEDRGFMFADAVYEVVLYYNGKCLAMQPHMDRLLRGLDAIGITPSDEVRELPGVSDELVKRNDHPHAKVYWQVTRGVAVREHDPPADLRPTVLAISYPVKPVDVNAEPIAVSAIVVEDLRWARCAIKSVMLLPNVLAKQQAKAAGAYEAVQHRDGVVTEGGSTNVFMVSEGALWTHPASDAILGGITRDIILKIARDRGMDVREQTFSVAQLRAADEIFCTGTTTHVAAITALDDQPVGDGAIGGVTRGLHKALMEYLVEACG